MARRRRAPKSAAQIAAAKKNLEKARAARSKRAPNPGAKNSGKDKRFTKGLAEARKRRTELQAKYGPDFAIMPGKKARQTKVGGRTWAANEARGYKHPLSEATESKLFKKGSRTRVSGSTGKVFTQSRADAIKGVRIRKGLKK